MAITIKVGPAAAPKIVTLELNIRKSVEGDLMIFDHGDIDIVVSPGKKKIVAFPKENINDLVYGAQNRLFDFLHKKGIVIAETIQGGAFYGAIEGTLQQSPDKTGIGPKLAIINISEFIEEERPYFEAAEAIIAMDDDALVHPDKEDSTDLGEVPQRVDQGSITPGYIRDPYSLNYMYTM